MPNQDGTGPRGEGARTGRGGGKCPADKTAGQPSRDGRGAGRGTGRGRNAPQK